MKKHTRTILSTLAVVMPFVVFSLGLYFFSPNEIVSMLRVENAYLIMFILALVGGMTVMSGVPYPLVLVTFALGGLNPLYLGLTSAAGVMIGDSTSYFVGYRGAALMSDKMQRRVHVLTQWYERHPRLTPVLFFAYGCCAPFSNDLITISSGLMRYSFVRMMVPLALGNTVFAVALAYASEYAYAWVSWFV